jgi:hypothetical protein
MLATPLALDIFHDVWSHRATPKLLRIQLPHVSCGRYANRPWSVKLQFRVLIVRSSTVVVRQSSEGDPRCSRSLALPKISPKSCDARPAARMHLCKAPVTLRRCSSMVNGQDDSPKRPGLLDELDRGRWVARRTPEWGEQAAGLLWRRLQDLRLLAVVVSLTFIVAVLSTSHMVFGFILAIGGVVSVFLLLRVRKLHKMAEHRRR